MDCKQCGNAMMFVRRFDVDSQTCFYKCPKCGYETQHKPLTFKEENKKKKNNKRRRNNEADRVPK